MKGGCNDLLQITILIHSRRTGEKDKITVKTAGSPRGIRTGYLLNTVLTAVLTVFDEYWEKLSDTAVISPELARDLKIFLLDSNATR